MDLKGNTTVTFHAGILTIGGTVIEVAYGNSHIFFDFGTEYRPHLKLNDELVPTLVEHQLIPHLDNVYDKRFNYANRPDAKTFENTAVFLSHVHLDHSRMVNYLDPSIPLYALKETKMILNSLNRHGKFILPSPFEQNPFTRDIIGLDDNQVVRVGDIEVTVMPVDHDAYGACALLIRTPDGLITYTGDLRLHGYEADKSIAMAQAAKHSDMLIMEGVSISWPERLTDPKEKDIQTEEAVIDCFVEQINQYPNRQITFNGYPANVLRFKKIVERSPRQVVLEANMAALVKEIFQMDVPYYYAYTQEPKNEMLNPTLEISHDTLLHDTSAYVWQAVNQFDKLQEGSLYLHSNAQPLGDFDPGWQPFLDLLESKNIEFVRVSCSGHAWPEDLNRIIDMIEPKLLVPIHTLHPENLHNPYGERILPSRGEIIVLANKGE
ncbi:MBL fold metallo-hydrolase [Carnobacteriaceae bacterium zg-C25]|nr:MBL fold metallo-hydrolase [Carnobacteriaceae bacterium zg-C25]